MKTISNISGNINQITHEPKETPSTKECFHIITENIIKRGKKISPSVLLLLSAGILVKAFGIEALLIISFLVATVQLLTGTTELNTNGKITSTENPSVNKTSISTKEEKEKSNQSAQPQHTDSDESDSETTLTDDQILKIYNKLNLESTNKENLKNKISKLQAKRTGNYYYQESKPVIEPIIILPDKSDSNGEKLLVDSHIGDIKVTFEVDTGSCITIISKNIYNKLDKDEIEEQPLTENFKDYSGNTIETLGLFRMPITLGNVLCMHNVLVTNNNNSTCLLGIDLIRQKQLNIEHSGPKIFLTTIIGSQKRNIPIRESGNKVTVCENTILEPGEITNVYTTVNKYINRIHIENTCEIQGKVGIGELSENFDEKSTLLPKSGLYELDKNGAFYIPVLNRTSGPITMLQGEKVLEWSPLPEGTQLRQTNEINAKMQEVNSDGKVSINLLTLANKLELMLKLKKLTPNIENIKTLPEDAIPYVTKLNEGEQDEGTEQNNLVEDLPNNKSKQAIVMSNNSPSWLKTIDHIYVNSKLTNQNVIHIVTSNPIQCRTAYLQLAYYREKNLPDLHIYDQYQMKKQPEFHINKMINKIKVYNDSDLSSEEDDTEESLVEDFFYQKRILPSTQETWTELLKDVPPSLKEKVFHLLTNKHRNAFSATPTDFGLCEIPNCDFRIDLNTSEPFSTKPYPLNSVYRQQIKETCSEMISAGLLLEEASNYGSGVFIRPRPDSSGTGNHRIRIIYDLRKLNSLTIRDNFPIPSIKSLLQGLANKKYFILIDLKDSYQSIPIHPKDRHKAAIVTADGVYTPTRMGYGFTNAPSWFSKCIAQAIKGIKDTVNYLDDIIISSNDPTELLKLLDEVLSALEKAGFKCSLPKLNLFKRKVKILGFVISLNKIQSDPVKIEAIKNIKIPETKTEVQRFLGSVNYHSNFIHNFANIAKPLYTYTSSSQENIVLSKEAISSFHQLKEKLTKPLTLNLIDPNREIYVETDASATGYGAIAYQVGIYDSSSIKILEKELEHIYNSNYEEIDMKLQEKIRNYVNIGKLPDNPIVPEGNNEELTSPYLQKPIQNVTINDLTFVVEINFFLSKKFHEQQIRSWSALMKEISAILLTIEKMADLLLLAKKVIILSDAQSAVYLYQQSSSNSIMSRYMGRLQAYPFTVLVRHKPGKSIPLADMLSRIWVLDPTESEKRVSHMSGILVKTTFEEGTVLGPAEIIKAIKDGGSNIVMSSSDPSITKGTQTIETTNTTYSKDSQTIHHTESNQSKKTKKYNIRSQLLQQVRKLLKPEEYSRLQKEEFETMYIETLTKPSINKEIINGILLINKKSWRRYTPTKLRKLNILYIHLQGHYAGEKMYDILSSSDYWPNMKKDCIEFAKTCLSCLWIRPNHLQPQQLGVPIPTQANETWQIDVVSGLPSAEGYKLFLSAIDVYTKFLILIPLKEDKSGPIAKLLEERLISVFGPPKYIFSDGATNMNKSNKIQELAETYGISLKIRCPYSSRSLGACERVHRSVLNCLRSLVDTFNINWYKAIPMCNIIYNSVPHSTTRFSPLELTFGKKSHLWQEKQQPHTNPIRSEEQYTSDIEHLAFIREQAENLQEQHRLDQRQKFGGKDYLFTPGMFCLAKDKSPVLPNQKIKFRSKYTGPFIIHDVLDSALFVESCLTGRLLYLHKDHARIIPEKDAEQYESLPALAKIKIGKGHTYEEWQTYLHDGTLLEKIDRNNFGVDYGVENLWNETDNLELIQPETLEPHTTEEQNDNNSSDSEEDQENNDETVTPSNRRVTFDLPELRRSNRNHRTPKKLDL